MSDVVPLRTGKGHYMALLHDDQRFFTAGGRSQLDKGLTQHSIRFKIEELDARIK